MNEARDVYGAFTEGISTYGYRTVLADPPWRFRNQATQAAPDCRGLYRYPTLALESISALPVAAIVTPPAHLYLWVPNALLAEGLAVMQAWGFEYKTNLVWYKTRRDGGPDRRGMGFYFRNVTELVLFGIRAKRGGRTLPPGRRQENIILERKREHSRKPTALYDLIERCSDGPYMELFARQQRAGWDAWGNETDKIIKIIKQFGARNGS